MSKKRKGVYREKDKLPTDDEGYADYTDTLVKVNDHTYAVHELLGRGQFGSVFRATRDGKEYALKTINSISFGQAGSDVFEVRDETRQEIRIMSELNDKCSCGEGDFKFPTLMRMVEATNPEKKEIWSRKTTKKDLYSIFIVMPFIKGMDLYKYSATIKKPSQPEFLNICWQICSAMKCLHDHGVVHRDMKLENIMIDDDMNVTIVDFGLACTSENSFGNCGTSWGNALSQPPELAAYDVPKEERLKYNKFKCEIYSVGVVLDDFATRTMHPFVLRDVITGMMHTTPSQRTPLNQCIDAIAAKLDACDTYQPTRECSRAFDQKSSTIIDKTLNFIGLLEYRDHNKTVQCVATRASGGRCTRTARDDGFRCWQHYRSSSGVAPTKEVQNQMKNEPALMARLHAMDDAELRSQHLR